MRVKVLLWEGRGKEKEGEEEEDKLTERMMTKTWREGVGLRFLAVRVTWCAPETPKVG